MTSRMSQRTNMPAQVSSFIGRERELQEIARLVRLQRFITFTGSGGTGKTRLAMQAAAAELDQFADGVWLIELAPLSLPQFVIGIIAKAVGASEVSAESPLETLATFLEPKRMLLIFDNCEHLLAECSRLAAYLLGHCPSVVIFATSREPLAISGEWVVRVPPLALPDASVHEDWEHVLDYDGIRLFVERARAAEPSFRPSSVTAPSVVEICCRLDGIPLALELGRRARARTGSRLPEYAAGRSLQFVDEHRPGDRATSAHTSRAGGLEPQSSRRSRTGAATAGLHLQWEFCPGGGRGRLCIRAAQLAATTDTIIRDLARLVDKSLVQLDHETGRYRLLETIRLYGLDRLAEAGETDTMSHRHFAYYLRLVEDGAVHIGGPGEEEWFTRLDQDHDNVRAALHWAIRSVRTEDAAHLALGLWKFWHARTYQPEGLRWLEQIQALDATCSLAPDLRPRLLNALGAMAERAHSFDRARAYHATAR